MAFHAIKAGEGDIFISAGVECVSQYANWAGAGGSAGDDQNPLFADAQARSEQTAKDSTTWTDPRERGPAARRLHRDGPDRRERRHACAASPASARTSAA